MGDSDKHRGHDYREVSPDDFRGLDRDFYEERTRFFEAEGYFLVGDVEDLVETRKHPSRRICVRLLVDGESQVAIYQVPATGSLVVLLVVTPLRFVDVETEFTDGRFLVTTDNGLGETSKRVDKHIELNGAPERLLEIHRERVRKYLEENPEARIRDRRSLGDVLEAQERQSLLESSPAKPRPRRKKQRSSRKAWRALQSVYDARSAIATLLTIVVVGLVLGYLVARTERNRPEAGRQLTLEQYERDFEARRAELTKPPGTFAAYSVLALLILTVFYLAYEGLRRILRAALTRLLEFARVTPDEKVSDRRAVPTPAAWGKIVFVLAVGLGFGFLAARRAAEEYEEGLALTREAYLEGFEARREEVAAKTRTGTSAVLTGLIASGAVIGVYELAAGVAMAIVALATGGVVSVGTHVFLSTLGAVFFFLAGVVLVVTLVKGVLKPWVDQMPPWTVAPLFLFGAVAFWIGYHRLLAAVPVPCRGCGGQAHRTGLKPLAYECRKCSRAHRPGGLSP